MSDVTHFIAMWAPMYPMSEFHHHNPREDPATRLQRQQENLFALLAINHNHWRFPLGSSPSFTAFVMQNHGFYTDARAEAGLVAVRRCWVAWFPLFLDRLYFNDHVAAPYDLFETCPFTSVSLVGRIAATDDTYFTGESDPLVL